MDTVSNSAIKQSAYDLDHKLTIDLTQVLAKCYGEGFVKAAEALEAKPHVKPDDSFRLSQDVERLVKPMKDYNVALADRVSELVQEGFNSGKDDHEVAADLREMIPALLKNEPITIQRPGKRPVSFTAEGYANMVAGIIPYSVRANGYVRGLEESGADGWQWVATGDERMCEVCGGLHGQVFGFETQFELPHPGCRCRPIANFNPKTKEEKDESERIKEKAKEEPWEMIDEPEDGTLDRDEVADQLVEPIYPSRYVYPGSSIERPVLESQTIDLKSSQTFREELQYVLENQTVGYLPKPITKGDSTLESLAKESGFSELPKVVDEDELDRIIAEGHREIWRGVNQEKKGEFTESFRSGEYFAGEGVYGNGIYTATGEDAKRLAALYSPGEYGAVMRMAIDKDAKVISYGELKTLMDNEIKKIKLDLDNEKAFFESKVTRDILSDPGRFAAINGYDAIEVEGQGQFIVLNRKALYIQNKDYYSTDRKDW